MDKVSLYCKLIEHKKSSRRLADSANYLAQKEANKELLQSDVKSFRLLMQREPKEGSIIGLWFLTPILCFQKIGIDTLVLCSKCRKNPVKSGLFCEECKAGFYGPDTGMGINNRYTDRQGRRRDH